MSNLGNQSSNLPVANKKPRLAIYSPFYYPELISTGKINTLMGNEVRTLGWEIDVVCSHPLYPNWKPEMTWASLPGTRFFRGGAKLKYPSRAILRRALLELWFAVHAVITTFRIKNEIDVAVFVYPPSLFALCIHPILPKRVRVVSVVHDLQGVYSQQGFASGFRLLTKIIHAVEKHAFDRSFRCIFFSKDMATKACEDYGLKESKIEVQYPFFSIDVDAALTNALGGAMDPGRQHVVYSGALGEKQNPEQLGEFMAASAEVYPQAVFHIFSGGPRFEGLRQKYEQASRLKFHDLIPEVQLPEMYARSSVQVLPQAVGSENGSLPSKLPNLLVTGVQILAVCSDTSEISTLLAHNSAAVTVHVWDKAKFVGAVGDALSAAKKTSHADRRAGSSHLFAQFQSSSLANLLVY